MSESLPAIFVSHGAPDIVLSESVAVDAMRDIARRFPAPRAIVVVSAHWIDDPVGVTIGDRLSTIHDFGGFPQALYEMQYPARGDDELSSQIAQHLERVGLEYHLVANRGLDHGAWTPLMIMYPAARVPVVQVSLPAGSLDQFALLGTALRPLRDKGVLIIGSGGSVHNLRAVSRQGKTEGWAIHFEQWVLDAVKDNHFERLITPTLFPQTFNRAHPTIEHYAPLVVAWAAGDAQRAGRRLHHSFSYGNLGMSFFEFGGEMP